MNWIRFHWDSFHLKSGWAYPPLPQSPNVPMTMSPKTPFFHFFPFFSPD